jgi:hypothetical protein
MKITIDNPREYVVTKTKLRMSDAELQHHKVLLEKIDNSKRMGDVATAAIVVGISKDNAQRALARIGSRYHMDVVNTLVSILESRNSLIKNKKQ